MKVEKKTDGGGFFDFFTRKKTEIERVWDNHVEKREVFIKELTLIIEARKATCKDREANATRKALNQLKKSAKSKNTTQFPKDLDTLKHIVDKWDDRVISYAKELGETCGSFRIVQRKSHLLLKIEERLDIEKRIENGIKALSNADASQDLSGHVASVTTLINTPSARINTTTTIGNPVYSSDYLLKPSSSAKIELLKERVRSNRHVSVTATVPNTTLYKVTPVLHGPVVYSKPPPLFASQQIGVSTPSIISMQPSDLRYELERLKTKSDIAKMAASVSGQTSENSKIVSDYSRLNNSLRNEIEDMVKTAETKEELMRKREKARKENNEQLQKQLDDQIKEKAVLQEKKQKEIKVLEEERNKIQKDAEKEINDIKSKNTGLQRDIKKVHSAYEQATKVIQRQKNEEAAEKRRQQLEKEKLMAAHKKEIEELNRDAESRVAKVAALAEEKMKESEKRAEEAEKAKTKSEEEQRAAQKAKDDADAEAAAVTANLKELNEQLSKKKDAVEEKQQEEVEDMGDKMEEKAREIAKAQAEELESRMEDSRKKEGDNISPTDLGMGVTTDEDTAGSEDDEPEPVPLPQMSDFDFVVALKEFPDETKAFDDAAENFSKMLKDAGRDSLREYDTKHARVMSLSANNSEDKKGWLGARSKLVSALTSFQQITSVDELDKEIKEIEEAINRKEKMMSEGDVTRQSQRVKEQDILKLQVLEKMRKYIKNKEETANKLARAVYSKTTSDTSSVDEVMKANENTTRSVLGSRSGNVFTFQQLQASAKRDSDETPMVEKPSPWIKGRTLDEKSAAKSLIDMKNDKQDKQDSDDDYSGDSDGDKEEKDAEEEQKKIDEEEAKKAAQKEEKKAAEEEKKAAEEAKKAAEEAKKAAEEEAKKAAEEEAKKAAEEEANKAAEEEEKKAVDEQKSKVDRAIEESRDAMQNRADSASISAEQLIKRFEEMKKKSNRDRRPLNISTDSAAVDIDNPDADLSPRSASRQRAKEWRDKMKEQYSKETPKGGKSGKSRKRLLRKKRLTKRR